jgi:hypothetical protein
MPVPRIDRDGDKRDMQDHNDQEISAKRDRSRSDPANTFQENLNGKSYVGPVNTVAADIVSGPMQGPRCAATGKREAELNKKQGY